MKSPPISRAVSRRPPPSKLIMPSAGRGSAARASPGPDGWPPGSGTLNAIVTGTPGPMVRATSARVLAGTSAAARRPGMAGVQGTVRTASRYRSVAASVIAVAGHVQADAGQHGQGVVAAGRRHDLSRGGGEHAAVDGPGRAGRLGQAGVLLDRQRDQLELGAAAGQLAACRPAR